MLAMPTIDRPGQTAEMAELEEAKALIGARRLKGAGGTPGGVGTFFSGLLLTVIGGYLVLNQVQVTSSFTFFGLWGWNRPPGFGLTMLPLLIGIGVLFFDGKSKLGWILSIGGPRNRLAAGMKIRSTLRAPPRWVKTPPRLRPSVSVRAP